MGEFNMFSEWWERLFLTLYGCLTLTLMMLKLCNVGNRRRGLVKMITSLAFVSVGLRGLAESGGSALAVVLSVGLCCASLGDLLLIYRSRHRLFVISVISFAFASAIISIYSIAQYGWRWWSSVIFGLYLFLVILGQRVSLFSFGRSKVVLNMYTAAVGICGSLGFTLMFSPATTEQLLFGLGCYLYWVSDIVLGLYMFKFRNCFVDAANTLLYFPGMFLIAASILV